MSARNKSRFESATAVDRQLARYRAMRDFEITSEPPGGAVTRGRRQSAEPMPFVVQKHSARQLHYDFRLGWHGVLKSWAVAKGPSYFPGDKRLAVEVEDHPMEYGGFEGTIPKGQYGGGTVMVWDFGDWQPLGDVERDLEKGNLKFILNGTKLKGKWVLVRMRANRDRDRSDKPNWLLIKEIDEYAQPEDTPAVTEIAPDSAITQRTIEQIAESQDHVWEPKHGLREPPENRVELSRERKTKTVDRNHNALQRLLKAAPLEDFPGFISPQLAEEARSAPTGTNWVHELKLDGYRTQVHLQTKSQHGNIPRSRLFTRKGLDWTARMTHVAQAAAKLGVESAILDGEVVALDSEGRSNFSDLQSAFQNGKQADLTYFAFDLLHLNGHNLRGLPLSKRKTILTKLLSLSEAGSTVRLCEHIQGDGGVVFRKACELGTEGIVSKLVSAAYTSGRGNAWVKLKCKLQQEFVIGGFTPLANGGQGIGALLLGYYDGGKLQYAGRCGTGFTREVERMLRIRLDALVRKSPTFAAIPPTAMQSAIWVRAELVAQVAFAAWSHDNQVLRASFKGLREDKPPTDIVRESPVTGVVSSLATSRPIKRSIRLDAAAHKFERSTALAITRPNKVLDEKSGMTKQQLAEYYAAVAERMLPHIADRPLSVLRCPNGVGEQCFFQKHVSPGLPAGIRSVSISNKKTGAKQDFLTLNTTEGLIGLAQLGVLEVHPWGSKNDSVDRPDRIIFDLDPDEAIAWPVLAAAALELRSQLKQFKLASFLKSTGGKGLHVILPIEPEYEWPIIKHLSRSLVLRMEKANPGLYITNMSKAARKNRIYLDYLRNDREATAIAPFSTRARPGVPVSVTLDWKELQSPTKPAFHVSDLTRWMSRLRRDPWKGIMKSRQRLTPEILLSLGMKIES